MLLTTFALKIKVQLSVTMAMNQEESYECLPLYKNINTHSRMAIA